jgi:hypothetical protein
MADETIIDKAMALLPGSGTKKRRATAAAMRQKQLGAIQRKLATLSKNVEKLAATIAADAKKAVPSRRAGKKPPTRKAPARKPGAKKPSGRKSTAAAREKKR